MEVLKELGLTKYESLIYEVLLKYKRLDARNISKYSNVPPTAVYPNLKSLLNKRLIQELKGEISIFEVLPPSIALDSFIKQKEKSLKNLKNEAIEQSEQLLNKGEFDENKEVMLLTHGKPASAETYIQSFDKAKESYYILGWKFQKVADKYTLLKSFKKMIKRGVDVRIILTGPLDKNWQLIQDYMDEGVKVKYLPLHNFSIFVMDEKECKFTLKDKKLPDRFNIQILDKSLSKAMHFYFLESWKHAKELMYDKKLKRIEA